ncbi:MAG TPA: molybdopterin-binding oxidoreductase [Caulobacteraceae bacterium]|jgi:hypothetical protein
MRNWNGWTAGVVAASLIAVSPAAAQSVKLTGIGGQTATVAATDLAAMPRVAVTLQLEGGRSEACEGVALTDLLQKVGAPQGKALRGPEMADVVEIAAADGYHVALALAETDALMTAKKIVLADRCNGGPMAAPEGPFRLVVEGDLRPARSARQVTSISVLRLPAAP